jgi:hypothetical protein
MRCILVKDANLKADTHCTYCRKSITESYARAIGSRYLYCDYNCYQLATETVVIAIGDRGVPANSGTRNS